jgi:hypothetical protein
MHMYSDPVEIGCVRVLGAWLFLLDRYYLRIPGASADSSFVCCSPVSAARTFHRADGHLVDIFLAYLRYYLVYFSPHLVCCCSCCSVPCPRTTQRVRDSAQHSHLNSSWESTTHFPMISTKWMSLLQAVGAHLHSPLCSVINQSITLHVPPMLDNSPDFPTY